jgi:hypothetical protein
MNQLRVGTLWILLVFTAGVLVLSGCTAPKPGPGKILSCNKSADVTTTIAPEASLEDFSYVIKKWNGEDTLHFIVAVKNISNKDQRFKVNIFLPDGKAVGGLIPRKIKKGLIKPGQTAKFIYPVRGMDSAPGKIDLFIKTMHN